MIIFYLFKNPNLLLDSLLQFSMSYLDCVINSTNFVDCLNLIVQFPYYIGFNDK